MNTQASVTERFLEGGGEMGELIRLAEWAHTPVGPISDWPQSLRTALSIMLESQFPMYIAWGPDFTQFYNDAYRPILGSTKHPQALGRSTRHTFAEIWDIIGPMFNDAMRGKAVGFKDFLLPLDRHGYVEECYFVFSYSPIRDETGNVGGVLVTVSETTERVLGERRLLTLRNLAERTSAIRTLPQVSEMLVHILTESVHDIPFALLYLLTEDTGYATLAGNVRCNLSQSFNTVDVSESGTDAWSLIRIVQSGTPEVVVLNQDTVTAVARELWPEPVTQAYVAPINRPDRKPPYGILVLGISPRRTFDEDYQGFFNLLINHVVTAFTNALAYETEYKRAEALMEIDQLKTVFFSNVSHEFRTPLTLMLGPIEEALRQTSQDDNTPENERMQLLHRNALRLLKLVNNLLDFSRIEAGRMQAVAQPTDLAAFTKDLASSFRSMVESVGLTYTVDCPPLPEPVVVDQTMWEKIVLNLLSNAYKFTFRGGISIQLRAMNGNVVLTVTDTGIGIPEAELPRIFQRFHRVQNAHGRTHEGAGIGLALAEELVRLHNGTITAQSREGYGSTFTVTVPLKAAPHPIDHLNGHSAPESTITSQALYGQEMLKWQSVSSPAPQIQETTASGRPRILVADDNEDMRIYISRLLSPVYEVHTVHDGVKALQWIGANTPDLILTDVMMPHLDGFGLLRTLRQTDHTRTIPVIMLSARASEKSRIEGINAGADDYLVKPFSAPELLAIIRNNLKMAEIRRESAENIRKERQQLYSLFMQAPALIGILRGREGICELFNPSFCKLWGNRDVIGKTMREAWPELEGQGWFDIVEQVFDTAQAVHGYETPALADWTNTGQPTTAYFNFVYAPLKNDHDQIDGVMIFGFNVTDQVEARRKAEESENRFRAIADTAPVLIWIAGPDKLCTFFNKNWLAFTGRTQEQEFGMGWTEGVHPDDFDKCLHIYTTCFEARIEFSMEYRLRRGDGQYRWLLDNGVPQYSSDGTFTGYIGSCTDITEVKLIREELEKRVSERTQALQEANLNLQRSNDDLEQFTYIASHDLQEPLRKIMTVSNLLTKSLENNLSSESRQLFDIMQKAANRMRKLIDSLLTFSRVTRRLGSFEKTSLTKIIAGVIGDLDTQITRTRATIHYGSLPRIDAIPFQMTQLFLNLLSNALKFSKPEVPPVIHIDCCELPTEKYIELNLSAHSLYYQICIADNGIGFDAEYADKIFVMFQRLHGHAEYEGTGIGLSICKQVVENHRGIISAESVEGNGSVFTIIVPAEQS